LQAGRIAQGLSQCGKIARAVGVIRRLELPM
jgi:hypothetical protein